MADDLAPTALTTAAELCSVDEAIRQCPVCAGSGSHGVYPDDGSPAECQSCGGEGLVTFRDAVPALTTQSGDERAAAEEIADLLESHEMDGEVGRDISVDIGPETRERIAAIITKHMPRAKHTGGPGGVSVGMSVAEDAVIEERRRQVIKEGWTATHDDEHVGGEMARAAGCYALYAGGMTDMGCDEPGNISDDDRWSMPHHWPWACEWWKPKNARHDLVRAAALIIAEIERLDRLQGSPS